MQSMALRSVSAGSNAPRRCLCLLAAASSLAVACGTTNELTSSNDPQPTNKPAAERNTPPWKAPPLGAEIIVASAMQGGVTFLLDAVDASADQSRGHVSRFRMSIESDTDSRVTVNTSEDVHLILDDGSVLSPSATMVDGEPARGTLVTLDARGLTTMEVSFAVPSGLSARSYELHSKSPVDQVLSWDVEPGAARPAASR